MACMPTGSPASGHWMTQGLQAPCGEPGFEQDPMAALVLHINREVIHHGAEISLLRDLFSRADDAGS